MDNAVALVQTYLRVNGYFTVAEYPVVEALKGNGYQMVTDVDILGFRFPGAGRLVISPKHRSRETSLQFLPDPQLGIAGDRADMLIGEVKEGRAELNRGAQSPAVLDVVLRRFGCCHHDHVNQVIKKLLERGRATVPSGHRVRLVAFGTTSGPDTSSYHVVTLGHVLQFLRVFIREHWNVLRHTQSKDPVLGILMTLEKASRGLSKE